MICPASQTKMTANLIHLTFPVPIRRDTLLCSVVVSLHGLSPYDESDTFGFSKGLFNRVFLSDVMEKLRLRGNNWQ